MNRNRLPVRLELLPGLIVGSLALAAATACSVIPHSQPQVPKRALVFQRCAAEDSVNCYWDAAKQGNGHGHSFYSIPVGHGFCTVYADPKVNRRASTCDDGVAPPTPTPPASLSPGWVKTRPGCITNYDTVVCGWTGWKKTTSADADVFAEAYNGPRLHEDFARCIVRYADTTTILCPDGRRFTS